MGLFGTSSNISGGPAKSETKGILKKKKNGLELKASSSWTDDEGDIGAAVQKSNKKAPAKAKFWRLHEDIAVENAAAALSAKYETIDVATGKPRKATTKTKNAKTFQRLDSGTNGLSSPTAAEASDLMNGANKGFRPSPLKRPGSVGRKDKARPLHKLPSVDEHKPSEASGRIKPIKIPSLRLRKLPQRGESPDMGSGSFAEYQPPEFQFGEFGSTEIPPPPTRSPAIEPQSSPIGTTDENRDKQKFQNFLQGPLQPCFSDDTGELGTNSKGDKLGDIRPTESGSLTNISEISGLYSESGFPTSQGGHNFQQIVFDNSFNAIKKVEVAKSDAGASDFSDFASAAAKLTKQLSSRQKKKVAPSAGKKKLEESPQRANWPRLGEKKRDTPAYNKPTDSPLKKATPTSLERKGDSQSISYEVSQQFDNFTLSGPRPAESTNKSIRSNEDKSTSISSVKTSPFTKQRKTDATSDIHEWSTPQHSRDCLVESEGLSKAQSLDPFKQRMASEPIFGTDSWSTEKHNPSARGSAKVKSLWAARVELKSSVSNPQRKDPPFPVPIGKDVNSCFEPVQPPSRVASKSPARWNDQSQLKTKSTISSSHRVDQAFSLPPVPNQSGFDIDQSWHQSRSLDESGFSVTSEVSVAKSGAFAQTSLKHAGSQSGSTNAFRFAEQSTENHEGFFEPNAKVIDDLFEPNHERKTSATNGFPFSDTTMSADPFHVPQTTTVEDSIWDGNFDPFSSAVRSNNGGKKSKMTSASSLDEGLIESIRSASAKKTKCDPDSHAIRQRDPSPRGVMLSSSDSALDKPRTSRSANKYSPGPQKIPPKAIPTNAILGSMLFRQTLPSNLSGSAKSASLRDNGKEVRLDEARDETDQFDVPYSVNAARDDNESIVSSVTEEASSFYQKSFGGSTSHRSWNKQAHDLVSNYGVSRSVVRDTDTAPQSKAYLSRLEEEHVKAFRSQV